MAKQKLTERLLHRQQQEDDPNKDVPRTNFTTVRGRRVSIGRMFGRHHRRILLASKGVAHRKGKKEIRTEDWGLNKWLLDELVLEIRPDGKTSKIKYSTLPNGEEVDLLYLCRLASLGRMLYFKYPCPSCSTSIEANLDIAYMKRFLQLPALDQDENHVARALARYDPLKDIPDEDLAVDWSELPEDYVQVMDDAHRDFTVTLPDSMEVWEFHLPMAKDKERLGNWVEEDDPELLELALSTMVMGANGVTYKTDHYEYKEGMLSELVQKLSALSTRDMLTLRDAIEAEDIGVDCEMQVRCAKNQGGCGVVGTTAIHMGSAFFLPRKVDSKRSSERIDRYAPQSARSRTKTG